MAVGNYGTVRPADVSVDDVEIFYTVNDGNSVSALQKIDNPNQVLIKTDNPENAGEIFGGLYTLSLPTNIFGAKGVYSIIIRPKQYRATIVDCGVLDINNDVLGMVLDRSQIPSNLWSNDMVGYRVEYLKMDPTSNEEKKINNVFRIITSNNLASVVPDATNGSSESTYGFNDSSSLMFCTLTPSSAPSVRPNITPYIGEPGQTIIFTSTCFDPIMVEIDMVEHDDETLAYALFGNQTKSLEDGVYTIYNFENSIYRQYDLYEIKNQFTGSPLYEVRQERDNIDFTKDFDEVSV
tara:strand:- start:3345 stop:4226 length:882 start_codon:yes stop_codon:yes gene_type:complete